MSSPRSPSLCLCDLGTSAAPPPPVIATLPRVSDAEHCAEGTTHIFWWGEQGLALGAVGQSTLQATRINFEDPALLYRLRTSGKRQGIGKAVGLDKAKGCVRVLDTTAGLGRDALVLAYLGCEVQMFERSPWVHALLEDGLRRAHLSDEAVVRDAASRMRLAHANSLTYLQEMLDAAPDVIYLDPMFPPRRKSAAVKKDIGVLQGLLGPDDDLPALLELALCVATRRVVVKRPPDQSDIAGPKPSFTLEGKAAHFSIYVIRAMSDHPG